MNAEMQVILDQLEEENLGIRKKAIEALKKWEYQLELEDACLLLEKAAEIKPLCEDEWDNPSYALVTAACIFIHEDMVPVIEKNILRYSLRAAIKVLSFLLVFKYRISYFPL
ncbi:hypothetical protein NST89_10410 [Caldifermentibacillus hisashii]|jgi:hypothetical protein|uniref:hypothetical protein n=1 Tax=Caldifermentibacillus hisashii TaxID=996558 RepID=UPI003136FAFE